MPLQNRVTPSGEILALPERGLFMGNRGILHDGEQRLGTARWRHPHWIICLLAFKGWHREVMQPRAYTELFFLDEATALAAGHRPCALCRRDAYLAFQDALKAAFHGRQRLGADDLDRMLHGARIEAGSRRQRCFEAKLQDLPNGVMVRLTDDEEPGPPDEVWLVQDDGLLRWRPDGYDRVVDKPGDGMAIVLTPRPTVMALREGYRPDLHSSANDLMGRRDDDR